ncbi:MAG: polysaccharide biosynthesis C-terminal domain-containing protein [Tannerella sp.]|jgi:O-antigen/teichoic acid export membrane protein|nr:polysaccharide biosynthesis C-terminal domain-containing protein [Tannerella sp.]
MLKKILGTVGTRYLIAFLNLLLIFINGKVLGIEGMGLVGVIYTSANIAVICNSILCGNTIIYFMNRYHFGYAFWFAYIWAFIGSAIACMIMAFSGMLPAGFEFEIYSLSILLSLVTVHSRVLLGKDRIRAFNITYMIQGGLLFFVLLYFYFLVEKKDAEAYVWGLFVTNGAAWVVSLILMMPSLRSGTKIPAPESVGKLLKEMFVYGLWSSADNLAEGLTNRLNYFLLQRLGGYGYVGLLDAGTKISESVWHISRSVSSISYSQTAKTEDTAAQCQMTLRYFKLTYCALISVMGIIFFIPEWVYTDYLFKPEFKGIQHVIRCLSAGIVALGANHVFSMYFLATGKVKYSTVCSCLGLITLLTSGYFLIPLYGVSGAAISTSIAFTVMLVILLTAFAKLTNVGLKEFLPAKDDFKRVKEMFRQKRP